MLTVLSERGSRPCVLAITSEARQGSIWSGVLVAAMSKPICEGSPPHSSIHLRVALTPSSVVELVAFIGALVSTQYAGIEKTPGLEQPTRNPVKGNLRKD